MSKGELARRWGKPARFDKLSVSAGGVAEWVPAFAGMTMMGKG